MNKDNLLYVALIGIAIYLLYKTFQDSIMDIVNPLGDTMEKIKKQSEEALKKKVDFVKKVKPNPKYKYGLHKDGTKAGSEYMAKGLASMLYANMKGVSSNANYAMVDAIIKKIKYSNDMKLVFKAFGIRENQNLADWVQNESMPEAMKSKIIGKISALVNKK